MRHRSGQFCIVSALSLLSWHVAAQDAALRTLLDSAKRKQGDEGNSAGGLLIKAFDDRTKTAATIGDLPTVKELLAAKQEFQAVGTVPAHPKLADDVMRYLVARRTASTELHKT